jgi:hypothetical protein
MNTMQIMILFIIVVLMILGLYGIILVGRDAFNKAIKYLKEMGR